MPQEGITVLTFLLGHCFSENLTGVIFSFSTYTTSCIQEWRIYRCCTVLVYMCDSAPGEQMHFFVGLISPGRRAAVRNLFTSRTPGLVFSLYLSLFLDRMRAFVVSIWLIVYFEGEISLIEFNKKSNVNKSKRTKNTRMIYNLI